MLPKDENELIVPARAGVLRVLRAARDASKTLAERAAWEFAREGLGPELVTVNPVFVLGPSLTGADNTSNEIVGKLLRREIPGCPQLEFPLVDDLGKPARMNGEKARRVLGWSGRPLREMVLDTARAIAERGGVTPRPG